MLDQVKGNQQGKQIKIERKSCIMTYKLHEMIGFANDK